jgi:single-strand DNA-binding protein
LLNKVVLIGRLTKDPELKYTLNGKPVATFSIAVNRKYQKDEVDYIDIVAWNALGENVANYISKGRLVAIDGRMQVRQYKNQEGFTRKVTEVVADDVRFLDRGNTKAEDDGWKNVSKEISIDDIDLAIDDGDIPF